MKMLSAAQVAEMLGISDETVRKMAARNELSSVRTSGRGHYRFNPEEIEAIVRILKAGGARCDITLVARAYREQQATDAIPKRKGRRRQPA